MSPPQGASGYSGTTKPTSAAFVEGSVSSARSQSEKERGGSNLTLPGVRPLDCQPEMVRACGPQTKHPRDRPAPIRG